MQRLFRLMQKTENNMLVRTMHGGLVMLIPVLLTGAFALALKSLPIPAYSAFIQSFAGGAVYNFFNVIYGATFQLLALYVAVFIGVSYSRETSREKKVDFGNIAVVMASFLILSGADDKNFTIGALGPKGMFTALFAALLASSVYARLKKRLHVRVRLYSDGTDVAFNGAIAVLAPMVCTVLLFAVADTLLRACTGVASFYQLFISAANALFSLPMTEGARALLYILVSCFLWFFGIHGSDCLEGVAEAYFIPAVQRNAAAVAAGAAPTEIFTKGFFDVFVLMGGCGTAICLLAALLLFSRRRTNRTLSALAAVPMLFNINEVMIFGLPVILNPIMLVPFFCVPLISFATTYVAMKTGLVPLITTGVEWTTPILLGGYMATGSPAGAVLQLVNLVLGTAVYAPFVRLLDKEHDYAADTSYKELVALLQSSEAAGTELRLSALEGSCGAVAKSLTADLAETVADGSFEIYYQPQYNYENECIGVESLLRWHHPAYGFIYPPLAIKLAGEAGFLHRLETQVLERVLHSKNAIEERFGNGIKISVNVTGTTVVQPAYYEFICREKEQHLLENINLCLEVTEQTALLFNSDAVSCFNKIRAFGIHFAIDDFSMGQTSIDYLKGDLFELVKLDGSLVRGIAENPHCYEIISSIVQLGNSLGIRVMAEFVETEQQKELLHAAGCNLYQGYLYSPAQKL